MLCGNPWAEGGGREGLGHSDLTTADTASLQGEPQAAGMVPAWTATQEPGPRGPGLGDAHSSLPAGLAAIDTHSLNLPAAPWRGEARPAPIPRDGGPDLLSIPRGGGTRPAPISRGGGTRPAPHSQRWGNQTCSCSQEWGTRPALIPRGGGQTCSNSPRGGDGGSEGP